MPPNLNFQLWLDASDVSTIEVESAAVARWLDKSGNGFHAIQSTAGFRPAYSTARKIGSVLVPDFDGTDDELNTTCPNDSRQVTTFCVGIGDAFSNSPFFGTVGSGVDGNEFRFNHSGNNLMNTLKENVAVLFAGGSVPATGTLFVATQRLATGAIYHYRDNTVYDAGSESSTYTSGRVLRVGGDSAGESWNGVIAELIRYPFTMEEAEILNTVAFLRDKWGAA